MIHQNSYPEPIKDCNLCPRLHQFIADERIKMPAGHNAPVAPFFPKFGADSTRLLIVGLAPGLQGANRTGRPFTGDYAGELLYSTLKHYGFAEGKFEAKIDDSLTLLDTTIVNAVRCVPPENKPLGAEINTCRQFFSPYLKNLPKLQIVVTLGLIAHQSTIRALGAKVAEHPFAHGASTKIGRLEIISSYHCSRYNTNTGRLTTSMFHDVFAKARDFLDKNPY